MYMKLDHLLTESTSKMFTLEMTKNIFFLSDNRAKTLSVAVFSVILSRKYLKKGRLCAAMIMGVANLTLRTRVSMR